jgi:hypothetical protein
MGLVLSQLPHAWQSDAAALFGIKCVVGCLVLTPCVTRCAGVCALNIEAMAVMKRGAMGAISPAAVPFGTLSFPGM